MLGNEGPVARLVGLCRIRARAAKFGRSASALSGRGNSSCSDHRLLVSSVLSLSESDG